MRLVELATTAATTGIATAAGASLTVRSSNGTPVGVGASDPAVAWADALQAETRQGPCVQVLTGGLPLRSPDVVRDDRWPVWGRRLRAAGLGACLAAPVLGPDGCDGVLEVYARTGSALSERDEVLLAVLAELVGEAAGAQGLPLASAVGVD